jgi:hypothetical protein
MTHESEDQRIFPRKRLPAGLRLTAIALVFSLAILLSASPPAHATVQVSGTAAQLTVDAKNATMPEILSGIQSALNTTITLSGSTSRQFSGLYSGSVRQVLSRLLDGTSHIIGSRNGGLNVILLASNGIRDGSKPAPTSQPATSQLNAAAPTVRTVAEHPEPVRPQSSPTFTNVAAGDPPVSDGMGWTGTPSELASRPAAQSVASAQSRVAEPPVSDGMGWNGTPSEFPARVAAQSTASASYSEPPVATAQGWQGTPSEMPKRP